MSYFNPEQTKIIKATREKLRAIDHPLREKMIDLLERNKRLAVTTIYVKLRLEQSVASQHLAILRRTGFVKTKREGKFIYYHADKAYLEAFLKKCADL